MVRSTRTFRVFISSTFNDLKEERNALQQRVFPELEKLCERNGCRFQAVDLRWGVSDEAGLDQQTMRICLDEIKRCQDISPKPNFIVLLGDRYGWCPLPAGIPQAEYEEIKVHVSPEEATQLDQWYWLDLNADPGTYYLQPRRDEFIDHGTWESRVERPLRMILQKAVTQTKLAKDSLEKYFASATEQEIVMGALNVPDARDHVFCFFRNIENLESLVGNLDSEPALKEFVNTDQSGKYDRTAGQKLKELKDKLQNLPPRGIFRYNARWAGSSKKGNFLGRLFKRSGQPDDSGESDGISLDHLDRLCEDVSRSLSTVIMDEIMGIRQADEIRLEVEEHETFARRLAATFTGRDDILADIHGYVGRTNDTLVVFGDSGSGKSALMAKALEKATAWYPDSLIVYRFIGVTPGSMELRDLLESLCRQLYDELEIERHKLAELAKISDDDGDAGKMRAAIEAKYAIPRDETNLGKKFSSLIRSVPPNKPLIIFLDALDQLRGNDKTCVLDWLPKELPHNVRLIVSAVQTDGPEGAALAALWKAMPESCFMKLPALTEPEGKALMKKWLSENERRLQEEQWAEVLEKFSGCPMPLYMKLAFEEVRKWRYYAGKPAGGYQWKPLGKDIDGIIQDTLKSLEEPSNHGPVLVSKSLRYLAASKNGLSEKELLDILSTDGEVMEDFRKRSPRSPRASQLPVIIWSRLYLDLKPYLTERHADHSLLLTFYHRQFEKAVAMAYLTGEKRLNAHRRLARFFSRQGPDQPAGNAYSGCDRPDYRKVSELPYQQTSGELWDDLRSTLTGLSFIEEKCAADAVFLLTGDYDRAIDAWLRNGPGDQKEPVKTFETWKSAIIACADVCAGDPGFALNHISYELGSREKKYADAEFTENIPSRHRPWLRMTQISVKTRPVKGMAYQTKAHSRQITSIAMSENGAIIATGGEDGSVILWKNAESFNQRAILHNLEDDWSNAMIHPDLVPRVSMSKNGDIIVSIIKSGKLCYWDTRISMDERTILEKKLFLGNPVVDRQGVHVAIGPTNDNVGLSIVEIPGGKELDKVDLPPLQQYSGMVLAADADLKRVAVARTKGHLWLWDRTLGSMVKVCPELRRVNSVAVSRNGDLIVAATGHPGFEVFLIGQTREGWAVIKKLGAHTEAVEAVAISEDGNWVASAGDDGMVSLWDIRKEPPERLSARLQMITGFNLLSSLSIDASGKFVIVGGHDGRLFYLSREHMSSEGQANAPQDSAPIREAAIGEDGKNIIWADGSGNIGISPSDFSSRRLICKANPVFVEPAISSHGNLRGWIQDSGSLRFIRDGNGGIVKMEMSLRTETEEIVSRLCISGDGRYAAAGTEAGEVVLITVGDRDLRLTGRSQDRENRPCRAISTSGSWVAIGSMEARIGNYKGYLWLWDGRGRTIAMETPHSDYISAVAVAGTPPMAASGSANGEVWIWSASKRTPVARADTGFSEMVLALDFHPSLKWLAAAGADKWLRIYDVSTGKLVSGIRTHDGKVVSCCFSDRGDNIAIISIDPSGEPVVYNVNLAGKWVENNV